MIKGLFQLTLAQAGFRQLAQGFLIVGMEGQSLSEQLTGLLILASFESQAAQPMERRRGPWVGLENPTPFRRHSAARPVVLDVSFQKLADLDVKCPLLGHGMTSRKTQSARLKAGAVRKLPLQNPAERTKGRGP
jgi:hypothetical protein